MANIQQDISHFFQRLITNSLTSDADRDLVRKVALMYATTSLGICAFLILGWLAVSQGFYVMAALDLVVVAGLGALLYFMQFRGIYTPCYYAGVIIISALYIFFFTTGSTDSNAFLWLYTFPLFALFLLGSRYGAVATMLLFSALAVILWFDARQPGASLYSHDFSLRFLPSFLTVFLFAYMFEKSREKAHQRLLAAQDELEMRVAERTQELQREINERISKEKALFTSELHYRTLFNSTGDAISIINMDGFFLAANKEFRDRLGYSFEDLLQMTPQHITSPKFAEQTRADFAAMQQEKQRLFETEQQTQDGQMIPTEITARRITFDDQPAIIMVARDIGKRKQTEEEQNVLKEKLNRAQKMEAIGLMAGGVAHDLNNILAAIVSYPQLMLMNLDQDSKLKAPLKAIQDAGKRAAAVVADLLTVARGVACQKKTCHLNAMIEEYLNSPEHQNLKILHKDVRYKSRLAPDLPPIHCSSVHIKKCLMNLVTNAAEAIEGEGSIHISSYNEYIPDHNDPNGHLKSRVIVLEVRDTGPGIPEKDMEHIFEPFYTKKVMGKSGTGLGLAIVWNTVHDHGGDITIDSDSRGTCFCLRFPASQDQAVVEEADWDSTRYLGQGEHILIIDDEEQLIDIAGQMLEMLGYRVSAASSGEAALAFLRNHSVDLVLLDMLMGTGMNGRETYEKILKIHPGQKGLIASGFSENDEVEKTLALGAGQFLKKPYTMELLGQAVHEVLHA